MMNTLFSKHFPAVLGLLLFLNCGCALLPDGKEDLGTLQSAVRLRMLKLQTTELLTRTAQERYNPQMAGILLGLELEYQESPGAGNDAPLNALENAVAYALVVLSENPEKTAEKLTADLLDYGTAVRVVKLKNSGSGNKTWDIITELAFMSDWSADKVKKMAASPLPERKIELFPLYPEAEQLLNERGSAAAFRAAAELYRHPSQAGVIKAERLRRAMLNRVLMQGKSPGKAFSPELYTASLRSRLFSKLLPAL